jgi:hypothetical protein
LYTIYVELLALSHFMPASTLAVAVYAASNAAVADASKSMPIDMGTVADIDSVASNT